MDLTSWLRIRRYSPAPRRNRMCTGCYRRIWQSNTISTLSSKKLHTGRVLTRRVVQRRAEPYFARPTDVALPKGSAIDESMQGWETWEYRGMGSQHEMSSVSSWQAVRTVQMTAQSPCHHPSTRPGVSGAREVRRWSRSDGGHATSCCFGQVIDRLWFYLCLPACYRIRISASVVLSSLGSIRGGPVGIGRARRRRIASQHVMWEQAGRCTMQLGQGLDLGRDLQKKIERERETLQWR